MSAFLPSCSSSVRLPVALIQGSVAYPRGFTIRLSHVPPWFELILGVRVEALEGNQVPLEWPETFGGCLEWWHELWSSSRLSCCDRLLLRCDGNAGNPFPTKQEKEPSSRAKERETGLFFSLARPSVFISSGDGYVTELLELQQRCEVPF